MFHAKKVAWSTYGVYDRFGPSIAGENFTAVDRPLLGEGCLFAFRRCRSRHQEPMTRVTVDRRCQRTKSGFSLGKVTMLQALDGRLAEQLEPFPAGSQQALPREG